MKPRCLRPDARISQVFLYRHPVDFRKSHRGLTAIVELELGHDPFSGVLYCFSNRAITRTTMANWLIRLHAVLMPLLERLEAVQLGADYLQGDETRIQVLKEPGMPATGTQWIWVMRGGPPGRMVVLFNYDKSRAGTVAERLLAGFTGRYFQSDGYAGYDGPCAAKGLVHLGCWDHARRKVIEAIKAQPKTKKKGAPSVAMVMLSHIDALYRLERQWKDLDDEERLAQRQAHAVPKLAALKAWLVAKQPKVAPDTLTRKAINYTQKPVESPGALLRARAAQDQQHPGRERGPTVRHRPQGLAVQ